MNKDSVLSIVRHLLTFGGGYVSAKWNITEGDLTAITAAIVALVGGVWGVIEKLNRNGVTPTPKP